MSSTVGLICTKPQTHRHTIATAYYLVKHQFQKKQQQAYIFIN